MVQKGSGVNDYVLTRNQSFSLPNESEAAAATDFIRVRAWSENPTVRILVFELSSVASGPCEALR